ncbi:stalk domain-containing protein [Ureibacillus sinduriensis]|uniref:stalk domain-containing protein n=1 Tax=Ureibacillus sinduriensis TaxID=561440 RepID=UPI00068CD747|nr:stalk domain-containing protein [Ureibacillus sinduriensis]
MKKFLVSSAVAGSLLIGGAVGAFAASNSATLKVFFNIADIKIDQVSKMPGNEKPFTYEGTTYVPLRYISESLGYPVEWEKQTSTIHIGETLDGTAYYFDRDIKMMNFQSKTSITGNFAKIGFNEKTPVQDNIGNEYVNYAILGLDNFSAEQWTLTEFALNGQYSTFESILSLTEKSKSTGTHVAVDVYLDDELTTSYTVKAGEMPREIKINTKNANKLSFKLTRPVNGSNAEVGLFEPKFYK